MCDLDPGSNSPHGGALFYRTSDRGKHWSITGSPPQDLSGSVLDLNLTGFFFLDKAHGWYSNYVRLEEGATDRDRFIGLLRATTDGGRTWKSVATSDQAFYALRFVTPLHGYAHYPWPGMGSAQSVVETRDGGATWTSLSGNPGGPGYLSPLANPVFFDATNGITVGGERDVGAVVRTTDGGQSWTRVGSLAKACGEDLVASIDNLSFPDSRHGWVLAHCLGRKGKGLRPIFARTTDTGRTWINLPTSVIMQAGKGGERLKVVSFIDRSTGYASTDNHFLVTDDAGKSFVPTGSPILWDTIFGKPHYENHVLSFANGNQGWAAERFRLFSTVDGGLNWDQVFADYWIQPALSALPSGRAWVLAGNTGSGQQHPISLLATSDRGVRWVRYQFSETVPVTVSFGDTQHGWIVDEAGYLYRTTDGGTNWVLASGP